jgi:hypothetical protein
MHQKDIKEGIQKQLSGGEMSELEHGRSRQNYCR